MFINPGQEPFINFTIKGKNMTIDTLAHVTNKKSLVSSDLGLSIKIDPN